MKTLQKTLGKILHRKLTISIVFVVVLSSCKSSVSDGEAQSERVKELNREIAQVSFSALTDSKNFVQSLNFEGLDLDKAILNIQADFDQMTAKSYLEHREKLEKTLRKEGISKIRYRVLELEKNKESSLFPSNSFSEDSKSFEFERKNSLENAFSQSQTGIKAEIRAEINEDFVRLREKPSLASPIVSYLFKNSPVNIQEQSSQVQRIQENQAYWYRIQTENQKEGWVFGLYVSPLENRNENRNEKRDAKTGLSNSLANNKIYQDFLRKKTTLIPSSYQEQIPKNLHAQNIEIQAKRLLITLEKDSENSQKSQKEEKLLLPFEVRGQEIQWYTKSLSILSKNLGNLSQEPTKKPVTEHPAERSLLSERSESNGSERSSSQSTRSASSAILKDSSSLVSHSLEKELEERTSKEDPSEKKASKAALKTERRKSEPKDIIELSIAPGRDPFSDSPSEALEKESDSKVVIPSEEIIVLELSPSSRTQSSFTDAREETREETLEPSVNPSLIQEKPPPQTQTVIEKEPEPWLEISWSPYLEQELSRRDQLKMSVLKRLLELRSSDEISLSSKTRSTGTEMWLEILDLQFAEKKASIGIAKKDPSSRKRYWKRWDLNFNTEPGTQILDPRKKERKQVSTRALFFLGSQKKFSLEMQKELWQISEWILNLIENSKNLVPPQNKDKNDYTA